MDKIDLILADAVTYIKIKENENYKESLLEAYYVLKKNNIDSLEKFESSDIGIGAFTSARTLSKNNENPTKASCPFHIKRDGFVQYYAN